MFLNSDFIDSNRMPSPEPHLPQERYQNTPSGVATLTHPLSSTTVLPTITISNTPATPTDIAATPTDIAATLTNSVAMPSDATATPTDTAALPSHSANINGIKPLSNGGVDYQLASNGSLVTDKLLDDNVSVG